MVPQIDACLLEKSSVTYVILCGGSGYSCDRGPSNGLPPATFTPFRLPAFPQTPIICSARK